MMLVLFIAVFSVGHFREVFARSFMPSAVLLPENRFGKVDLRHERRDQMRLIENAISNFVKQEELLEMQMEKFNIEDLGSPVDSKADLNNIRDEIEQSFVLVETMPTRQRGKRYIQKRSHLTPCFFKICSMGRKRQPPVL